MKIAHIYAEQTKNRASFTSVAKRYAYFWEIAAYLNQHYKIDSFDTMLPEVTLYSISKIVCLNRYKVAIFCVRNNNIEDSIRYADFLKQCNSTIKILFYGDLISLAPDLVRNIKSVDAIVTGGDYECAILSYLKFVENNDPITLKGIYLSETQIEYKNYEFLGNDWLFSDLSKVPYQVYNGMIIDKGECTISVQRGCPYNCDYCLATKTFSFKARQKSVESIVEFCEKHKDKFASFRFFAPIISANNSWLKELCSTLIKNKTNIKWCSTTRMELLKDEELIELMIQSGCYKISVGIETTKKTVDVIDRNWDLENLQRIANITNKYPIDYNNQIGMSIVGLVMLGIPGQNIKDVSELFTELERLKVRIRPTSYTPLEELVINSNTDISVFKDYDKFTFYRHGIEGLTKEQYYMLLFNPSLHKVLLNDTNENELAENLSCNKSQMDTTC